MTVAQDYPARTDSNGTRWWRPVRDPGMDFSQWGWTSNPEMAHPSYAEEATLCALPLNVTDQDRAAILEFQAELQKRSVTMPGWLSPESESVLFTNDEEETHAPIRGSTTGTAGGATDEGESGGADTAAGRRATGPGAAAQVGSGAVPRQQGAGLSAQRAESSEQRRPGQPNDVYGAGAQPPMPHRGVPDGEETVRPPLPGGDTLTELRADGPDPYPRRSEYMGFPLPPFPEQVNVDLDRYNRYKLPSPTTGKLTAYTRATTVATVTSDDYNLAQWKIREKVRATLECAEALTLCDEADGAGGVETLDQVVITKAGAFQQYLDAVDSGTNRDINRAIDLMHDLCGGAEAREHGGAVHDWLAELAMGKVLLHQIPEEYQVHAKAYQEAMARAGLIDVPAWTERLVLNTRGEETVAGRLDGIAYCVTTGEFVVIDRKTSKTLDFSWLEYSIQFAIYGWAQRMLSHDRQSWEPMPKMAGIPHWSDHADGCPDAETVELFGGDTCETCGAEGDEREAYAYCIHVPSDQPERSQVVPFNISFGAQYFTTAVQVRAERKDAEKTVGGGTYPIPTVEALRYVQARQRLQNLQDADDAMAIMQEYEDVWDDDLATFGAQCFELLDNQEVSAE